MEDSLPSLSETSCKEKKFKNLVFWKIILRQYLTQVVKKKEKKLKKSCILEDYLALISEERCKPHQQKPKKKKKTPKNKKKNKKKTKDKKNNNNKITNNSTDYLFRFERFQNRFSQPICPLLHTCNCMSGFLIVLHVQIRLDVFFFFFFPWGLNTFSA